MNNKDKAKKSIKAAEVSYDPADKTELARTILTNLKYTVDKKLEGSRRVAEQHHVPSSAFKLDGYINALLEVSGMINDELTKLPGAKKPVKLASRRILEIAGTIRGVDPEEFVAKATEAGIAYQDIRLVEDLGMTNADIIVLAFALESEYEMNINDNDTSSWKTLADVCVTIA